MNVAQWISKLVVYSTSEPVNPFALKGEGKTLGRPRVPVDVEKVRKLQSDGMGLRGIAAKTGWSLSSIMRTIKVG